MLRIINLCAESRSLYSALLISVRGRGVYTPHYYSLCGVAEFILHIINPCAEFAPWLMGTLCWSSETN